MKTLTLDGENVVADGEVIGRYNAEKRTLHCPKRISPRLYPRIAELLGGKPEYDFGELNESQGGQSGKSPGSYPGEAGSTPAPATISDDPEPARAWDMGDKDPAWLAWLKRNRPEEFAARFAGYEARLREQEQDALRAQIDDAPYRFPEA